MSRSRIAIVITALLLTTAAGTASDARSIPIPDDFAPEGIAVGADSTFYVGSLWDGDIYRGSLRTGKGELLVDTTGSQAAGLKVERARHRLWVAGGVTGRGLVYDTRDGSLIADLALAAPASSLVNDVVVTSRAAYFTDSLSPVLYIVPLSPKGRIGTPRTLDLTGPAAVPADFPGLNGIAATAHGGRLIVGHTSLGAMFVVDPRTGASQQISLPAGAVPSSDGIILEGRTLWVVNNFLNQVVELKLAPDLSSGVVKAVIDNSDVDGLFRVPTTIARKGDSLVLVNGRFDVGLPPPLGEGAPAGTEYDVVVVDIDD
jgi:hypothetical protein